MLQKVNKERIIASQDVPQSTTTTTSTATTTVTPPTTATSSNATTPSTTSSTTTEGMYYNSSVLNETKLNEIAYLCLGDIITEKQNLHNMKNNRIRLTESQLHSIIRKCVNEAVNESHGEPEQYPCVLIDAILEDYEAEEIADDLGLESADEAAMRYFSETMYELGEEETMIPKYHEYVDSIDGEHDLYRDYGAGYYFVVVKRMAEGKKRSMANRLNESIRRTVRRCVNEAFKSQKLQQMYNDNGGFYGGGKNQTPYNCKTGRNINLSDIEDDDLEDEVSYHGDSYSDSDGYIMNTIRFNNGKCVKLKNGAMSSKDASKTTSINRRPWDGYSTNPQDSTNSQNRRYIYNQRKAWGNKMAENPNKRNSENFKSWDDDWSSEKAKFNMK